MYQTLKARIDNGHIIPLEPEKLPDHASALITVVPDSQAETSEKKIENLKTLLGAIKIELKEDPVEWQRHIRSEWD